MTERNGMRYGVLGLIVLTLLIFLGLMVAMQSSSTGEPTAPGATAAPALESLAALDGQAPARRALDIQTWTTAEGAKVLFVAAPQLPMFDLRLTFAAGSSQDGNVPGLAMLTNAMLNEGVAGKDVGAIAEGFEGLGANFGNGAYRDMAVASLRSLSQRELREPALALFTEVLGAPSFPADSLARIQNQLLAGFEYQKQNPGKLAGIALFEALGDGGDVLAGHSLVEHGIGQGGQAGHVVVAAASGEGQAQVEHRQLARLDEQHAGAFGGLPVLNVEGALGRCLAVEGGQRLQAGGWRGNLRQRRGLGVAAGDIGEQADQQDQAKAEQAVTDALALAHGWTPSTAFSGRI